MKGILNKHFTSRQVVAVELFSAGWCNLSCKYCYIPKTDFLKEVHRGIIQSIEDGTFINDIKELYGSDLESISHWGTEPTLTIRKFKKFYEEIAKAFPKFKECKVSSNFMTNPNNLVEWVTEILPKDRSLQIDIQVSLDGPPFITDKNRVGGSTDQIVKNCLKVTSEINRIGTNHKVSMHLKPTICVDDIYELAKFDRCLEYYEFFDDFMTKWIESNNNDVVNLSKACDPTLVFPGTYTSEDGKMFYKLLQNQLELKKRKWKVVSPESNYYWRFRQKFNYYRELYIKPRMFVCSAGDSCFALGDKEGFSHICHQSFYLDHEGYFDEAKKYGKLDEQTVEGMEKGRINIIKDNYIKHKDDVIGLIKMTYNTRAYNDFMTHKASTIIALILEEAECGHIDPCFKDLEVARIFAYFMQVAECPMHNLAITGSKLVGISSLIKLFGNGVFQNIFRQMIRDEEYINE